MAVVFSEPHKELVGGGENAKYIQECKELYLGNKGIEKLRGFEPFVNLESLWLNGNKLKKLDHLDANFRIKTLYAQNNVLCTLKGSLQCFHFLEQLDLSGNALRDLEKQLKVLEKFKFLTHLNLKGNPCCEEPDYLLHVVHALPSLRVLDQHMVTDAECTKAKGMLGGDVATLTVSFMRRTPVHEAAWSTKVPVRSTLEQELGKEAVTIRNKQEADMYTKERALFAHNPHPEVPRGTSLPPNAGTRKAMEQWHQQSAQQKQEQASSCTCNNISTVMGEADKAHSSGGKKPASGGGGLASPQSANAYKPRDVLVLYSCKPSDAATAGLHTTLQQSTKTGTIKFEAAKYEKFARAQAAGKLGNWSASQTTVVL